MANLVQQRCFHHGEREAVARCPECTRYFCRECITEHDDRVICASCLKRMASAPFAKGAAVGGLVRMGEVALGLFLAWFFFFAVGEALLTRTSSTHRNLLWQVDR